MENDYQGRYESASKFIGGLALSLRQPVFRVGEILILDENDRDQFGRNPGKWDVSTEYFDSWGGAVKRVLELMEEASSTHEAV